MEYTFREDLFRFEVDTGSGGQGFTDTLSELMEDAENENGNEVKAEVETWALNSKEGDEFQKYRMYITNIGKWNRNFISRMEERA